MTVTATNFAYNDVEPAGLQIHLLEACPCNNGLYVAGGCTLMQVSQYDISTCCVFVPCNRNSQGFCCECTLTAVYEATLGNGGTATTRANLNCGLFAGGLFFQGVPGSAHCFRYANLWYAVCRSGLHVDTLTTLSLCMHQRVPDQVV